MSYKNINILDIRINDFNNNFARTSINNKLLTFNTIPVISMTNIIRQYNKNYIIIKINDINFVDFILNIENYFSESKEINQMIKNGNKFVSSIDIIDNEYYMKLKISERKNHLLLNVFNNEGNNTLYDVIKTDTNMICKLSLNPIWNYNKKIGLSWIVKDIYII